MRRALAQAAPSASVPALQPREPRAPRVHTGSAPRNDSAQWACPTWIRHYQHAANTDRHHKAASAVARSARTARATWNTGSAHESGLPHVRSPPSETNPTDQYRDRLAARPQTAHSTPVGTASGCTVLERGQRTARAQTGSAPVKRLRASWVWRPKGRFGGLQRTQRSDVAGRSTRSRAHRALNADQAREGLRGPSRRAAHATHGHRFGSRETASPHVGSAAGDEQRQRLPRPPPLVGTSSACRKNVFASAFAPTWAATCSSAPRTSALWNPIFTSAPDTLAHTSDADAETATP